MFRDLSREKADAVRLEVGRDVYGILDSREFEDEFKRLSTALAPALLPTSQKPLSLLDRQILERMARDYEAQIAERAQKSMDLLQHDLVAKWNARQGLTTWHDGDPVPPSAEQDNTGQFRRGMAGMIGGGLNFRFGYSSQASPEVENSFLGVADLKQQLLEAQLAYLKSR